MITEDRLAERFAAVASPSDDSDWTDVRRRARNLKLRRTVPLVTLAVLLLLAAPAVAFHDQITNLFVQGEAPPQNEPTVTSMLGVEPVGLDRRMTQADTAGPSNIQCEPGDGASLVCHGIADGEGIPALKRGETVYGRTTIGLPRGARYGVEDVHPHFESTDLVCAKQGTDSLVCYPVTVVQPTIREDADVFVFYKRHNVTFDKRGNTVGHIGEPTIPFRIVPKEGS